MKRKQRLLTNIFVMITGFFIVLLLFPNSGLAVEFSITNVKIDAFLQEDGSVRVKEQHTYSFDGDFNGITREIIPKKGAKISKFKATEKGKGLRVEKDDSLYKVHRKGTDETIKVDLTYTIYSGVDVYSDVAEFYWPFFDERNQSTYEKLTVTIHPPQETDDTIAFGYDEAFKTENISSDGTVVFRMGEVPLGENGDIRVVYDAELFSQAPLTANKTMQDEILAARHKLLDEDAANAAMREKLSTIASIFIPLLTVLFLLFLISASMRSRLKKAAVERDAGDSSIIPIETMTLPATILYTHGAHHPAETMAAALMDLVRKGFVQKDDNDQFIVSGNREHTKKHERFLIEYLFYKIGSSGKFTFNDLSDYTKFKKNHQKYWDMQTKWLGLVREEIAEHELYEKNGKVRLAFGLSSLLLVPFFYFFPAYDLFGWFTFTIFLFSVLIITAIVYHPKSWQGLVVDYQWDCVKKLLNGWNESDWKSLTEDEKMRAYIYGLGIKEKNVLKNSKKLDSFDFPANQDSVFSNYSGVDMATMVYFGPMATSHFYSAKQEVDSTIHTSSSSSGGGGTGGGGGGSGAF